MSKSKKVTYARMHTTIFVPNVGQYGPELTGSTTATNKGVAMTLDGDVVTARLADKTGKPVTVLIPLSNFTNMVIAELNETDSKG